MSFVSTFFLWYTLIVLGIVSLLSLAGIRFTLAFVYTFFLVSVFTTFYVLNINIEFEDKRKIIGIITSLSAISSILFIVYVTIPYYIDISTNQEI